MPRREVLGNQGHDIPPEFSIAKVDMTQGEECFPRAGEHLEQMGYVHWAHLVNLKMSSCGCFVKQTLSAQHMCVDAHL